MSINKQLIEENRAFYDSIGNIYPVAEGVAITEEAINNIECYWLQIKMMPDARPNIVFNRIELFYLLNCVF